MNAVKSGETASTAAVPITATAETDKRQESEQTVFRVFGGGAPINRWSWTPIDPRTVPNYRDAAGLPNANTGTHLVQGSVKSRDIKEIRSAFPADGKRGGLLEYVINPVRIKNKIVTQRNPAF